MHINQVQCIQQLYTGKIYRIKTKIIACHYILEINKMKVLILTVLMVTCIMITIYVVDKHFIQNDRIKPCTSNLVIVNKNSHLDLLIDFFKNNGKGKLTISGVYFIGATKVLWVIVSYGLCKSCAINVTHLCRQTTVSYCAISIGCVSAVNAI